MRVQKAVHVAALAKQRIVENRPAFHILVDLNHLALDEKVAFPQLLHKLAIGKAHPTPTAARSPAIAHRKCPSTSTSLIRAASISSAASEAIQALYDMGYRHFISGGAPGMDMFAAEAVLELRAQHPDMILEMVSSFDDQAARWSPELRARYDRLFSQADIATGHAYTKNAMFRRNHYLVDNADLLLAAYDGQPGGTAMTCELARRYDVPGMKIKPAIN